MMQADIVSDVAATSSCSMTTSIVCVALAAPKRVDGRIYKIEAAWAAAYWQALDEVQLSRHCWECL